MVTTILRTTNNNVIVKRSSRIFGNRILENYILEILDQDYLDRKSLLRQFQSTIR